MSGLRLTLPPWQTRVDPHLCRTNKGEGMSPPYTKNRNIVLNRDYQCGFYLVHFYTSLFSFYLSIKRLYSSKTRSGDSDFIWRLGVSSLKKKPLIFQAIDLNKVFLYPVINPFTRLVWRLLISTRIFLLLPGPMSNNLPSIKTLIAPFRLKRMVA